MQELKNHPEQVKTGQAEVKKIKELLLEMKKIQKNNEKDENSIKNLNSGNSDMEDSMFIDKQKTVAQEKERSHQILCNGTGFWSLNTPAGLVSSSESLDWKLHVETTGIAITAGSGTPELRLKAYSLLWLLHRHQSRQKLIHGLWLPNATVTKTSGLQVPVSPPLKVSI